MPKTARFERLSDIRRRHGTTAMVWHMVDRLCRRSVSLDVNHMLSLDTGPVEPRPAPVAGFTTRFLSAAEVRQFAADPENCLSAPLADRLDGGDHLCLAGLVDGRLATFGWFALRRVAASDCDGVCLTLPAETAYFYNGFTRPDFRGRGLYVALLAAGLRAMAERGFSRLLLSVRWTNWGALSSCRRLGCRSLGCCTGVGRGRLRLVFPPRLARREGVGFHR